MNASVLMKNKNRNRYRLHRRQTSKHIPYTDELEFHPPHVGVTERHNFGGKLSNSMSQEEVPQKTPTNRSGVWIA